MQDEGSDGKVTSEEEAQALRDGMLSPPDADSLVEGYVRLHMGETEDAQAEGVKAVLDWAYRARLDQTTLDLALKGALVIDWDRERGIVPRVTEAGRRMSLGQPQFFLPRGILN